MQNWDQDALDRDSEKAFSFYLGGWGFQGQRRVGWGAPGDAVRTAPHKGMILRSWHVYSSSSRVKCDGYNFFTFFIEYTALMSVEMAAQQVVCSPVKARTHSVPVKVSAGYGEGDRAVSSDVPDISLECLLRNLI